MTLFQRGRLPLLLAVLAMTGLLYDATVHLQLAPNYDAVGSTVTQGWLFRLEAIVAIAVALALVVSEHRLVWAAAGLTGIAGVVAVVLYRYVDVGALGPIPNMYEPVWFGDKLRSACAEGAVAIIWLLREGARARDRA